jgi:hypothetical protein
VRPDVDDQFPASGSDWIQVAGDLKPARGAFLRHGDVTVGYGYGSLARDWFGVLGHPIRHAAVSLTLSPRRDRDPRRLRRRAPCAFPSQSNRNRPGAA